MNTFGLEPFVRGFSIVEMIWF